MLGPCLSILRCLISSPQHYLIKTYETTEYDILLTDCNWNKENGLYIMNG